MKISNSTIQRILCLNSTWKVGILVNRQPVKRYMYIVTVTSIMIVIVIRNYNRQNEIQSNQMVTCFNTVVKELRSEMLCHLPVQVKQAYLTYRRRQKVSIMIIYYLYLESRRCRYRSIIFACFYLYITVVIFIDYSDIDKMMDINNEKC